MDPNAVIAKGYDNVMVTLKKGDIVAGLLSAETADELTLKNPADAKLQRVKKADDEGAHVAPERDAARNGRSHDEARTARFDAVSLRAEIGHQISRGGIFPNGHTPWHLGWPRAAGVKGDAPSHSQSAAGKQNISLANAAFVAPDSAPFSPNPKFSMNTFTRPISALPWGS